MQITRDCVIGQCCMHGVCCLRPRRNQRCLQFDINRAVQIYGMLTKGAAERHQRVRPILQGPERRFSHEHDGKPIFQMAGTQPKQGIDSQSNLGGETHVVLAVNAC